MRVKNLHMIMFRLKKKKNKQKELDDMNNRLMIKK